ncbi:MAG: efflux RND transporter periplasmic adaptor subunit [Hyphomonadaceae bacterium]
MKTRNLLLVLSLFAAGCGSAAPDTAETPAPLVEVIAVAPARDVGAIRASGLVGYKRETPLAFDAPGVVGRIEVDEGDVVRRGQRLATLRRTTVGSNAQEAAVARQTAERQLARTQQLFDRGFASQAALDDARLAVERTREVTVINAPAAGIILRRNAEPAQTLAAGAPVLVLGETGSGVVVRAAVPGVEAQRIEIGAAASVHIAGHEPRAGQVARIAAQSDMTTGVFEVEVRLENIEGIRSGQVAEVEIAGQAPSEDAQAPIIIPALSLLDARADQGVVFVVDAQSVARRRAVQTGGLSGNGIVVISGLNPGERIVAAGAAYVRDGEPVRIAPSIRS